MFVKLDLKRCVTKTYLSFAITGNSVLVSHLATLINAMVDSVYVTIKISHKQGAVCFPPGHYQSTETWSPPVVLLMTEPVSNSENWRMTYAWITQNKNTGNYTRSIELDYQLTFYE